jgi:uncharacterized cupin superfamily protein
MMSLLGQFLLQYTVKVILSMLVRFWWLSPGQPARSVGAGVADEEEVEVVDGDVEVDVGDEVVVGGGDWAVFAVGLWCC